MESFAKVFAKLREMSLLAARAALAIKRLVLDIQREGVLVVVTAAVAVWAKLRHNLPAVLLELA